MGGGGVLRTILGSPDPISDQKMSKLAYFFFFVTHLSKKDSKPIWLQKGSTPPPLWGERTQEFFLKKSGFRPVLGNPRQSCLDSTPGILDSVIFVSGTWIPYHNRLWDSSFLELYSGFKSPE